MSLIMYLLRYLLPIGKISGLGKINLRILNFQLRGNPKYNWGTKMKDKYKSHQHCRSTVIEV